LSVPKSIYRRSSRLPLPWERTRSPLRGVLSGRRMLPLLGLCTLLGLLVIAYQLGTRRAQIGATRAMLVQVDRATRSFVRDFGRCPQDTNELVHPPKSGRHYLGEPPVDAWGRSPHVRCQAGAHSVVEVVSAGANGSFLDDDNVM
jgi:hypothetical protein